MLYGAGKYTYELVEGWTKLPEGVSLFFFLEIEYLLLIFQ